MNDRSAAVRRLKRRMADLVARCAMASWAVLVAMPLGVVIYALA